MRKVGDARNLTVTRRFSQFLRHKKIEISLQPSDCLDGLWQVWVLDEDKVKDATFYWKEFENSLGQLDFEEPLQFGEVTLGLSTADESARQDLGFESTWIRKNHLNQRRVLTLSIIVICCLLFALTKTSLGNHLVDQKRLSDFLQFQSGEQISSGSGIHIPQKVNNTLMTTAGNRNFASMGKGELWRSVTPCLLHCNFCQLIANSVWLWVFAKEIETRAGKKNLLLVFLISSSICNLAEYVMIGVCCGGMAGVIGATAAFCAVKRHYFPWEDYRISENTLFFYCLYFLTILSLGLSWNFFPTLANYMPLSPISIAGSSSGLAVGYLLGRFPITQSN